MNNRTISFVTASDHPNLTPSDRIAADVLRARGANVVPALWDDPKVQWQDFNAIIVRSTWDYHYHPERFIGWLRRLERLGSTVWNPIGILRWNMDKHYLRELAANGIPVPRTFYVEMNEEFDLQAVQSILGVDDVVVKPTVSASAWQTRRARLSRFTGEEDAAMTTILNGTGVMIQEFMPEVETEGELSFLFFGLNFSHAVRKRAAPGDFRVQDEHGGKYFPETPSPDLVRQARQIVASVHESLLYARVDGIVRSGKLILMELELIEPLLYFDVKEESASLFCERLEELIDQH